MAFPPRRSRSAGAFRLRLVARCDTGWNPSRSHELLPAVGFQLAEIQGSGSEGNITARVQAGRRYLFWKSGAFTAAGSVSTT